MRTPWPALLGALGAIALGLVLLGSALLADAVSGDGPSRTAGSSWAEGPAGASRLHSVLVQAGRTVFRHEASLDRLTAEGVLVVLDPPGGLRPAEETALLERVARGATLVLATDTVPPALARLGLRIAHHPLAGVATPRVPSALARAGAGLVGRTDALLAPTPGLAPLFATDEGVLLGGLVVGEGTVFFLTDPGQLSNAGLEHPVNARLARALFPGDAGPVTFVEALHGYTAARGLLPWLLRAGWGPMLLLVLLAAATAGWRAAGRAPLPAPIGPASGGGLVRLARAVGRMRLSQDLHARSLGQLLQEARRRRIPEDHPAVVAARRAWRQPDLTADAALAAAVALEQTWR